MKKIIFKSGKKWGFEIPRIGLVVTAVSKRKFYKKDFRFACEIGEGYFYDLCDEYGIEAYSTPREIGED